MSFTKYLTRGFLILIAFLIFNSCEKDNTIIPKDEVESNEVIIKENQQLAIVVPTEEISTFLIGEITDEQNNPIKDVEVSYGSNKVFTDAKGIFTFKQISINKSYAYIKAKKEGYLLGSRTFTPTENAVNTIGIMLLSKGVPNSFNAATGAQITIDGEVELNFPPNSIITKTGNAYSGDVKIYGRFLSPTNENLSEIMPGILAGLTEEGTINPMISYGMFTVELEDEIGNELEIEGNSLVEVKVPANSNDPTTIPLWHFNETYGLWIESGTAIKEGDKYVSEVNHFSTWNLDASIDGFSVEVYLKDQSNNSLANQTVKIYNEYGQNLASVYTDNLGKFKLINAPQILTFKVVFECELLEFPNKDITNGYVFLTADLNTLNAARTFTLYGQLTNCINGNDVPFTDAYFTIQSTNSNDDIYFSGITNANGDYEITSVICNVSENENYEIQSTVYGNNFIKDSVFTTNFNGIDNQIDVYYCGISNDTLLNDSFVIPFEDYRFEQTVRDAINKPTGPILYEDIKNLTSLNAIDHYISNISGIEYFTSLESLVLKSAFNSSNSIEDISPLASLTQLEVLNLQNNSITNLSSLYNLTNLKELNVSSNRDLTDISTLAYLTKLEILDLSQINTSDISAITNLDKLRELSLVENNISSISPLSNLFSLERLILSFNNISDISPISNLSNLDFLDINQNNILNLNSLCDLGIDFDGYIFVADGNYHDYEEIDELNNCLPNATISA